MNWQIAQHNSAFNAEQARLNREFQDAQALRQMTGQEIQREDQYQTAVADMKAAGLNPMLAYSQGGARPTSGAAASGSQASASGNPTMLNTKAAGYAAALQIAQTFNVQADTELKEAQRAATIEQAPLHRAHSAESQQRTEALKQEMQTFEDRWEKLKTELGMSRNEYWVSEGKRIWGERHGGDWVNHPEVQRAVQEARDLKNRAELHGLKIPGAINEANFEKTEYGKYKPAVEHGASTLGKLIGSASDAKRAFSPAPQTFRRR